MRPAAHGALSFMAGAASSVYRQGARPCRSNRSRLTGVLQASPVGRTETGRAAPQVARRYTRISMQIDVSAIQRALKEDGLDGWLWFDFRGSNPIARKLAGLEGSGKMTTRRWYYMVPAEGEPRGLVHAIERYNLDQLPGRDRHLHRAASRSSGASTPCWPAAAASRWSTRPGVRFRICRGWTPAPSKPSASAACGRRALGTSSSASKRGGSPEQMAMHRQASESLYRIKDQTFAEAARRLRDDVAMTELDLQQLMLQWFAEEGLVADSTPNVSAQENAGDPHYHPSAVDVPRDQPRRGAAAGPLGQARPARARCTRTSPGWASPGARSRPT